MHVAALIVAAGRGTRLGGLPKQFRSLGGEIVLARSIRALLLPQISAIQVVIADGMQADYAAAVAGIADARLLPPVVGGRERADSVRAGLVALASLAPTHVLIHDAARPLVERRTVDAVLATLAAGAMAAYPAVAVVDTLRRVDSGQIVPRDGLLRAQTPQGFDFARICAAHAANSAPLTDDIAVAMAAGIAPVAVPGQDSNIKLTTADDFIWAERWLAGERMPETRMGQGFDVHAFGPGDHVVLCGIKVPHDRGFIAHSDGDVAWHALTDALLGAVARGDIGRLFPPSDPQWKGADSALFLARAADEIAAMGGRIVNVDVTIICERPKITPVAPRMMARTAQVLRIEEHRVSVKATTTEQLGFTGRREGIAAMAVATVEIPSTKVPA